MSGGAAALAGPPDARAAAIADFLAAAGWGAAQRAPLAGDASPRRYERLARGRRRAVLMDAPPEGGVAVDPFLAVTTWLRAAGFSAPEILAADPGAGLLLLEDLGDDLFARHLERAPRDAVALYGAAVDLLAALQRLAPPAGDFVPPPYDRAFLLREARLVLEWYAPGAGTSQAPAPEEFDAALDGLLDGLAPARPVAVLRDYHAENLVWLPARRGSARVGLLDYQDMLIGHPAYDLVSLLADARRDIAPDLRSAMTARHAAAADLPPGELARAARVLAVQRNLKILGLFARLARRDGKPAYLRHLPRVWGHLARDLAHPELAPLAALVGRLPAPTPPVLARLAGSAP